MNNSKKAILVVGALLCLNLNLFSQTISLKMSNVTVKRTMTELKEKSGYSFVYAAGDLDTQKIINVEADQLKEAIEQILQGQNVSYEIKGKNIVIQKKQPISDKKKKTKISGSIKDVKGEPIIGATVMEKGTNNGTVSDMDGNFTFDVNPEGTLHITYIGYANLEVPIAGKNVFNIQLREDTELLDEVVVVGFGTQKKINLTGAVSVISSKELKERPVTNAIQSLQGMVPGLRISQTSGSLESQPSINVRGTTTIGQGTNGNPLILIDGMEGELGSLNSQDIESISVLKDAAASSIYGSRAPFGVILVTTKSGTTEGKASINYNNSFRWGNPVNMNQMMNSMDFASWMNDTFTNNGDAVYFSEKRMEQIEAYRNAKPYGLGQRITNDGTILDCIPSSDGKWTHAYSTAIDDVDWYDALYRKWTFSQEHNFSVKGGSKKFNYYASFNYFNQGGLMEFGEEGLNRYNGTAKISSEITKWLKFDYTMRFTREDLKRPTAQDDNLYKDMARRGWPVLPLYDPNGHLFAGSTLALYLDQGGTNKKQADNTYHQVGIALEPIKRWITRASFNYRIRSINNHWSRQKYYNHDVEGNAYPYSEVTYVHEDYHKENYFNFNVYTEYGHQFSQKHNVHIMAGFQAENLNQLKFGLKTNGLLFPDKPEIDLSTGLDPDGNPLTPETNGARHGWATAGFFGRVNYDYDGKYLVEANLRADGTSRFRKDNRWKAFPSVSVGWNIARENFFQPISHIIGTLKLRASYGSLGNQNTNNWYQTYQTMSVGASDGSWLMNGVRPNTALAPGLVSTTLTWENIQTYNIGFDWGLLSNRLTGTFEYYIRDTKDMVGNAPALPAILGTAVPVTNNTDLRTSGWELSIGWNDRLNNGISYGLKFNISDARTKITNYPNNPTNSINTYIAGRYTGEIWGYTTIGIAKTDQEMREHLASLPEGGQNAIGSKWAAGDVMYADLNGDGKISAGSGVLGDTGDRTVIGNQNARYLFGLDLNASWKGFDLRMFFQGVMKRDYWQGSEFLFGANGSGQWWAAGITAVDDYFRDKNTWSVQKGYQNANLDAYLPRPLYNNKNLQTQTRYLQNAAYIRLKNLQFGYTLPKNMIRHFGMENLRIYFSGENLWTGSKLASQFDPETVSGGYGGNAYPLSRTLSCGVSVTF